MKTDEWETPKEFYEKINNEFKFTLDPCATEQNHKTEKYYTEKENGLEKSWENEIVFCNPPYSKIKDWTKKAYEESKKGTKIIMLIPARTDTKYFHEYILNKAKIRFIKGRLRFGNSKQNAPFPSLLIIYN